MSKRRNPIRPFPAVRSVGVVRLTCGQSLLTRIQHHPSCRVKRRRLRRDAAQCGFPRSAVHAGSNGSDRHRSFAAGPFDVSVAEILLKNWIDGRHRTTLGNFLPQIGHFGDVVCRKPSRENLVPKLRGVFPESEFFNTILTLRPSGWRQFSKPSQTPVPEQNSRR